MRSYSAFLNTTFLITALSMSGCGGSDLDVQYTSRASTPGSNWTCSELAGGSPGLCPDCAAVCAELVSDTKVNLAINIDPPKTGWLCSADVTVKQGTQTLFTGPLGTEPIDISIEELTLGDSETVDGDDSLSITVDGTGTFAASCP